MKKILLLICTAVMIAVSIGSCGSQSLIPAGNTNNYGYVLVDGEDIYYTKVIMTDLSYYGNIYKYNTVSKKAILVAETEVDYPNEMNAYMTLYNGELYFLPYFMNDSVKEASPNIYKVKPDGENIIPEPLFDKDISCTFMQFQGGLIYYYDDAEEILYSVKPNGSGRKVICKATMYGITLGKGKAYFTDYEMLGSVSLRGGEPKYIFDFMEELEDGFYLQDIVFDGNYIYYSDDDYSRIGRIKPNGKDNQDIYVAADGSAEYVDFFNVSGDTVFIVVENYGAQKNYAVLSVSANGGEPKVVVSDAESFGDILPVSIWGDTIYFCGMPIYETVMDSDYVWFTVRKSGGTSVPFEPFNQYDEFYDWEEDSEEAETSDEEDSAEENAEE